MDQQRVPKDKVTIAIGVAVAGAGLYFILMSIGVAPLPGGKSSLHGPLWILFFAGLSFLLAGINVLIQVVGSASQTTGMLPSGAPNWMRVVQFLTAMGILASLAIIGSWIAIGPGPRKFAISGPFTFGAGEMVGRVAFGIGATIVWLCLIVFTVSRVRKSFGRKNL